MDDKDQIKNVDDAIAVGVWGGLTEAVGDLHQIQNVDDAIAVDIGGVWDFEVYLAVKVGEEMSFCLNQMSIES